MKKNFVLIPTILLLMWFFLDMIGISFNNTYLVSRSFGEDGVFFIIYLVSLLLYIFKEKIFFSEVMICKTTIKRISARYPKSIKKN